MEGVIGLLRRLHVVQKGRTAASAAARSVEFAFCWHRHLQGRVVSPSRWWRLCVLQPPPAFEDSRTPSSWRERCAAGMSPSSWKPFAPDSDVPDLLDFIQDNRAGTDAGDLPANSGDSESSFQNTGREQVFAFVHLYLDKAPTQDPTVTPSDNGMHDQGDRPPVQSEPEHDSSTIRDLRKLLKSKDNSDQGSWATARGPEKGVRWRGGTPPAPPKWHYAKDDLRAFSKFERRVSIWQLQVKPYMSEAEAALSLYCSLSGEPEEELEHLDIKKLYAKDGISFLMEQLRGPLQAKQIYLKRKYLSDYETIGRAPGESLRNYVNRYHRAEKALLSIGIDVGLTYDAESRGSRLLDRAKLSTEQQRMVLVGTNQSLNFEDVKNALVLQYPDHKPAPFLQGQSFRDQGQPGSTRPPKGFGKSKNSGKGNGFGSFPSSSSSSGGTGNSYRRAYVAEAEDQQEDDQAQQLDAIPEDDLAEADDGDDDPELIPDEGEDENIDNETVESLMEVLTVTSRKLQAMTQGRKYRGAPRKSIEERKKSSACSACGQVGHWAGDPECSMRAKGKAGGKGKHQPSPDGDKKGGAQKVFSVRHAGGHEILYDFPEFDAGDSLQGQREAASRVHRTLVVFQSSDCTCLTNLSDLQGYCVVDTACQRSCSSRQWCHSHVDLLKSFGLSAKCTRRLEAFQFGAGPPQRSDTCMYFPVAFDVNQPMIAMSASVLDNVSIPFLASLAVLKKMKIVLDLARQKAYIGLLDCTVDLHLLQGHLCLKISEFPASAEQFDWSALDHHDCEFLCSTSMIEEAGVSLESSARDQAFASFVSDAGGPSNMVEQLEAHGASGKADLGTGSGTHTPCVQAGGKERGREHHPGCKGDPGQAEKEAANAGAAPELHSSFHEETRQCSREVRNMHRVPRSMEVGRRWSNPWVALSSVFQVLCAALAVGPECGGRFMDTSNGVFFNGATGISGKDTTSADFSNLGVRVPWDTGDGDRAVPPGRGGRGGRGLRLDRPLEHPQHVAIKKGTQKRMINNIEKSIELLNRELHVYHDQVEDSHHKSEADFLELFWCHKFKKPGLECSLAQRANHYGLSFVDLGTFDPGKQPQTFYEILQRTMPRVLMVHNMQRLWNHGKQLSEMILKCCEHQVDSQASFIIDFDMNIHEDPFGIMAIIGSLPGTREVIFKDDPQGTVHTFVTNSKCLARASKKAPGTHDIADAMLASIQGEVRMKCPWRFDVEPHNVWYAPPVDDPDAWMSLLESLEKRLGRSRYFYLSEGSKEMKQLKQLVPWEITRAQVCAQPMTRRLPSDIPFTHRGAALLLNTGKLHVESEDMNEVRQPKLKFDTPVRTAILFYGMAEDDKPAAQGKDIPDVHVPGLRTDISFPGIPETITKEVKAAVARLHCNAGHPPKQELIRLLAAHGSINAAVLTALDCMKCGTCERARAPLKPRPAAVPEFVGQFAEQLQADVFYIRDLSSVNHPVLGVTCLATKFYQAALLPSREPQMVLNELDRLWLRPYGYPLFISVDADGAFEGVFLQHLQESGVIVNVVPADGHHQIGAIERRNAVFRSVVERLIDQNAVTNKEQLDLCMSAAIWAVNTSVHTRGRSSMQAVFGKLPRYPGDLFSDGTALASSDFHLMSEQLRSQGCQAVQEMAASSVIRRALLRKTATSRAKINELLPGSLVAYWRWNLKARGRKRGGYILGRLVVKDDKNAWVQSGGSLVQVTHEQLRPAVGIETWVPSAEDVRLLKEGGKLLQEEEKKLYKATARTTNFLLLDVTFLHRHSHSHSEENKLSVFLLVLLDNNKLNTVLMLLPSKFRFSLRAFSSRTFGRWEMTPGRGELVQDQWGEPHRHHGHLNYNLLLHDNLQPQEYPRHHGDVLRQGWTKSVTEFLPHLPREQHLLHHKHRHLNNYLPYHNLYQQLLRPRSFRFHLTFLFQLNQWIQQILVLLKMTSNLRDRLRKQKSLQVQYHKQPGPAQRRRSLTTGPYHSYLRKEHMMHYKLLAHTRPPCIAFRCAAAKILEEEVSSDSSADEESTGTSRLTRQERKAIDREIPWRKLMSDYPSDIISLYVQANKKEYDSWMSWNSIRALSPAEATKVKNHPVLRKRIMPSRNAYRDKNRGAGPSVKAKCRTVIQGCHDPDLGLLDRSSPTPTRLAEYVIYEIACAGYNRRFLKNKKAWKLWAGDVSTAFLQGQPQARDMPIFMKPPRDDIQAMAGTFTAELYEIIGNLYGLCNAPRTWINHIVSKLLEANFQRHRLDHTVYYKLDANGELMIVLLFHVDDFLVTYREDYRFKELQEMFTWGQTNLLDDGDFVFKGKEVSLKKNHLGEYKIVVTQKSFIDELETGKLPHGRLGGDTRLSASEVKEYRSCAGSLQWLSGTTRPDIAATVSLSNHGTENGPQELQKLFECIDYLKATPTDGLTFSGVALNFATTIVCYADSSWANAPGGKSQMGVLVLLTGPECQEVVSRATILDWRSSRSPRVTRSTLASEANAMDEGVDRSTFLNVFLSELLCGTVESAKQRTAGVLKQLQVTDCKSLYDGVISDNPSTEEKRTMISIRSIQALATAQQLTMMLSGPPDRMLSCVVRVTKLPDKEAMREEDAVNSERLIRVFAWPPFAITAPPPGPAQIVDDMQKPPAAQDPHLEDYVLQLERQLSVKAGMLEEALRLHRSFHMRLLTLEEGLSWKDNQLAALAQQFEDVSLKATQASRACSDWKIRAERLEEENCAFRNDLQESREKNQQPSSLH
ncbi:Copia protein [Symbiodinium microadriaticum]|uniref:Copia protein n=1 Tax=Symbiodinium microadriaticum TaxID=2951 RepID=A0A1Q9DV76_SYMMI|nr:Copia protein [Symbiodinium microadriaticum]